MIRRETPSKPKDYLIGFGIFFMLLILSLSIRPIENNILEFIVKKVAFVISIIGLLIFALCWFQVFRSACENVIKFVQSWIKYTNH